ncbi:histidine--tRNA ligase [Mycoplasma sp. 4404]|uniref:histidine--tRNA ligase n=1 Tax=Mycoplasma sp. 4404 TaxID=3108530 RepID=UPI002B1DCC0A|nr:histidine--tRNA ligase [Mycoplasma sp. 4404]MEA4162708.1 histidine--tRNA ligase [Mycoplasma sp. 4404]
MITKIKGTKDYSPVEFLLKDFVTDMFTETVAKAGYVVVETPIMEQATLFRRSVDDSEIVKKEMYEFKDKGDRDIALRPEGTAPFVRALIEQKWLNDGFSKFAYYGPMFRYEQPQKGRYRQFYQAGVEFVGEKTYTKDVEVILLAAHILDNLMVDWELKINTIGDEVSRKQYEEALYNYLLPYKSELSKISQERLESKKVLRILDDKEDSQKPFIKNAPKIADYLSDESKEYFVKVTTALDAANIEYKVSNELVRGLDYYDETVFEFVTAGKGSTSGLTLIGGGRYSNLIAQLGGDNISSVGFGMGIDRVVDVVRENAMEILKPDTELRHADVYIAMTNDEDNIAFGTIMGQNYIATAGLSVYTEHSLIKNKKLFEKAAKRTADFLVYDDKMIDPNLLIIRDMVTGEKVTFSKNEEGIISALNFILENSDEHITISDSKLADVALLIEELEEGK